MGDRIAELQAALELAIAERDKWKRRAGDLLAAGDTPRAFTASPYERFTAPRMHGVFAIGSELQPPVALFLDEEIADSYHERMIRKSTYVVLAVDGLTGWAWNDMPGDEDSK